MTQYRQLMVADARKEFGFGVKIPANCGGIMPLSDGLLWTIKRASGTRAHRVFVECPVCLTDIPASRLHQHMPAHGFRAMRTIKCGKWINVYEK